MKIAVVGGGVIGLCSAYYLQKSGHEVTVIDKGNLEDGCSFGNMGYISPSHFLPLASPGIVKQGIKWMFDSSSPFYVKPRIDLSFAKWSWYFNKAANAKIMNHNAQYLNALLQLSRSLIKDMVTDLGNDCSLTENGCFMLYKKESTGHHEAEIAKQAASFGLKTVICDSKTVQDYEPDVETDVAGGVLYIDDCYVAPADLMRHLLQFLKNKGVTFVINEAVTGFEKNNEKATAVITPNQKVTCDAVVVANGSWMEPTAQLLGIYMPMQPGKGYSFGYENLSKNIKYPSILVDDRVATTPYGSTLRMGGTMELSGHSDNILPKRVQAIYTAFKKYYPLMDIPVPDMNKVWYGYRPVTPDGMPYIGTHATASNVCFAGGHAMLGVSAANATGQLVSEIIAHKKTSIDTTGFRANRF